METTRLYAWLSVREVDDDKRIIEGIATTPMQARDGDILVTEGIQFRLPVPFLFKHREEMGNVISAKVGPDGIRVRIQVAPAGVSEFIDESWRKIKAGIVRGLSIGWRTLEETFDKSIGGFRITRSEWLELSAVPVPADPHATITSIRTADEAILAASGTPTNRQSVGTRNTNRPGVSGIPTGKPHMKSFAVRISELEEERLGLTSRMSEIMETTDGQLTAEQSTEYDEMKTRATEIDTHLERLRVIERSAQTARSPVQAAPVTTSSIIQQQPQRIVQEVRSNHVPGIGMARVVIAMANAKIRGLNPVDLARQHYRDMPEVAQCIRAVVEAGDTTTSGWASQLVPAAAQMQNEFLEVLRAATIVDRLGLKQVPFNVAIPIETASGTAQWVGEGAPKPVTKPTYTSTSLTWAKAAAIVVITKELAKFSSPSAEMVVRDSMVATLVRFFDSHFVSSTAAVANVSPAGILNGIASITPTGTSASTFRVDMNNMLNNFTANNVPLSGIKLIMSATQAVALSLMVTDLGVPLFPSINRDGGSILGFPVVISEAVGTKIIGLNVNEILLAQDPGISVDISETASVEMDDAPAAGEQSPVTTISTLKSFWQNNLVGIRVEQFKTWKYARTAAVEYIDGNAYVPS